TGDMRRNAWSPGWVPAIGGWDTPPGGYIYSYATCRITPAPFGGRSVGIGVKHYSSCPYPNTSAMVLVTYWPTLSNNVILSQSIDTRVLDGFEVYLWVAHSDCDHAVYFPSYNPFVAAIEIDDEMYFSPTGC